MCVCVYLFSKYSFFMCYAMGPNTHTYTHMHTPAQTHRFLGDKPQQLCNNKANYTIVCVFVVVVHVFRFYFEFVYIIL